MPGIRARQCRITMYRSAGRLKIMYDGDFNTQRLMTVARTAMTSRMKARLGNASFYAFLLCGAAYLADAWIIEPVFLHPSEPVQCGPHRHLRPVGEEGNAEAGATEQQCVDDMAWACSKAARILDNSELAEFGCAPVHR